MLRRLVLATAMAVALTSATAHAQATGCPTTSAASAPTLSALQLPLTNSWGYNHTPSRQDAIWTVCTGTEWVQYMVVVGPKKVGNAEFNVPWIQRRTLPSGAWSQPVDLGPAFGITGPDNDVKDDLHNGFTVWTDPDGYIHVIGNVHSESLTQGGQPRYVLSATPHDLSSFAPARINDRINSDGTIDEGLISDSRIDKAYESAGVTKPRDRYKTPEESYPLSYPQFVKAPGRDNAYLFVRAGNSMASDVLQLRWDPLARKWTDPRLVISDSNRQTTNVRSQGFCPDRRGFPQDLPGQIYKGLETASSTAPYVYRIDVETGSRAGDTAGRIHVAWTWRKMMQSDGRCIVHSTDKIPLFAHVDLNYATFNASTGTWSTSRGEPLSLPIGKNGDTKARVVAGPGDPVKGECSPKEFETFLANRFGFSNDGGVIKTRTAGADRVWIASTAQREATSCTNSLALVRKPFAAQVPLTATSTTTIADITEDADQNPATPRTVVPMRGRPALVSSKWDSGDTTAPLLVYVNETTGWPMLGELTGAQRHAPLARVDVAKTEPVLSLSGARNRNQLHLLLTPSETSSSVVQPVKRLDDGSIVPNDAAEYANRDKEQRNFDRQHGSVLSLGLDEASRTALFSGAAPVPEIATTQMATSVLQRSSQVSPTFGSSFGLAGQLAAEQRPLVRLIATGSWLTGRVVADLEAVTTAGTVPIGRVRLGASRRSYTTAWLPLREKLSGMPTGATLTGFRLVRTNLAPAPATSGQIDMTLLVGRLG